MDARGKNDYRLWRPIVYSYKATKSILGLIKVFANKVNLDEREKNDYTFVRPIVHSNFEVTKLILGLVAQNTYRNA